MGQCLSGRKRKLRQRHREDVVPSWRKNPLDCEDSEISSACTPDRSIFYFPTLTASQTNFADAYTDEGKCVCIKRISRNSHESRIAQMLSTKELRLDPRNHCAPVIEVVDDPDDDSLSYMVMPFLRNADSPPFQYIGEIIDFVNQILEVKTLFLQSMGLSSKSVGIGVPSREWGRSPVVHPLVSFPTTLTPR